MAHGKLALQRVSVPQVVVLVSVVMPLGALVALAPTPPQIPHRYPIGYVIDWDSEGAFASNKL